MRLLIAMMRHETNTFSPVPTDLQRFALGLGQLPPQGAAAVQAFRHTGTATGAFIDLAEAAGAEFASNYVNWLVGNHRCFSAYRRWCRGVRIFIFFFSPRHSAAHYTVCLFCGTLG